ncbi:hypothetical protein NEOKW01_0974 [Nematocida sp. AWRm80]|nr:hypothetical protein NEOKW01_0974 [Nematocida sp. AWRm80]
MLCTAGIFYNKRAYTPGELVSGHINLQVSGVFSVESIVLIIDKESGIRIEESDQGLITDEKATRHLGRFIIYSEKNKKMNPGVHKFPFSFRMMPGEGATIEYNKSTNNKKISVLNRYISKCEVKIYGIFKPIAKVTKEILVVENAKETVKKRVYKQQIGQCLCFNSSSADMLLGIDSVIYAGTASQLDISTSDGSTVSEVSASLEMSIQPYSSKCERTTILFPCKVQRTEGKLHVEIEEGIPSETNKNDFFSITYQIVFSINIKGKGTIRIPRKVSVRSKRSYGIYSPPEIPDSSIYPEKYLSLQC